MHTFTCKQCRNTIRSTARAPRDGRCIACTFPASPPAHVASAPVLTSTVRPLAMAELDPHERRRFGALARLTA